MTKEYNRNNAPFKIFPSIRKEQRIYLTDDVSITTLN